VRPRRLSDVVVRPLNFTVRRHLRFSAMFNLYPLFIAVVGFAASMALIEPMVRRLPPDTKSALMDAFASARWLNIAGAAVFAVLLLWRVQLAWIILGAEYCALNTWSLLRLRTLGLPSPAVSRMSLGLVVRTAGLVVCSAIYALRLSH